VIVGAADVDAGARHLERALGVAPRRSGSHPGRGTHNAVAAVAGGTYVESLAPDPAQPPGGLDATLRACDPPRLLAWVVQCDDIDAATAAAAGVTGTPAVVEAGSRTTATGALFRWRFGVLDPRWPGASVLPGLVQWGSAHPSEGAVSTVSWTGLRVETPDHEVVAEVCRRLSLDVVVVPAASHRLVAVFERDGREVRLT
jgi:hypothetical protein